MQQQKIISSSCRATSTKYKHNSFKLNINLISLISLIFLSALIEAVDFTSPTLQNFANYAAAAYCTVPIENWDCGKVCQATEGTKVVKVFTNEKLNTKGFIALYESEKLIIVSYRGTVPYNVKNFVTDLKYFKKSYTPVSDAEVHIGFYDAFLGIQPQVTNDVIELHKAYPDFQIVFLGHSLGGALATFSALDMIQQVPELANKDKLFLVTFGQPRVGNEEFAEYVEENLQSSISRTIIRGDPVTRLPPRFTGYKHYGEEYYIEDPDIDPNYFVECDAEDDDCSASVSLFKLRFKAHTGPHYGGVEMTDCIKDNEEDDVNESESEDYDFSADPNFSDGAKGVNGTANGVDGAKGVNGTVNGVAGAKGVNGTANGVDGAKGVNGTANGVDGAKGVNGTANGVAGAKGVNGTANGVAGAKRFNGTLYGYR